MTADQIIDDIIQKEGRRYTNNPSDHGHGTKFGITEATLTEWRGHPVQSEDVEALTESEAREIYFNEYIKKPGFGLLTDPQIQAFMVDAAVNHGVAGAIRMLQKEVGVPQDGRLGPQTLAAINAMPQAKLYRGLLADRIELYGHIVSNDHSQIVFLNGWLSRAGSFIRQMS